jgi:hypothetical protein
MFLISVDAGRARSLIVAIVISSLFFLLLVFETPASEQMQIA